MIAGKPHAPIYNEAIRQAEVISGKKVDRKRVLAIGDGMPTDVKGARDNGIDLLFISDGIHAREYGQPLCYRSETDGDDPPPISTPDRRLIFIAIINCIANQPQGSSDMPVEAYASAFLVNPMSRDPNDASKDSTLDIEVIDIAGRGGNGTLSEFLREESYLVR